MSKRKANRNRSSDSGRARSPMKLKLMTITPELAKQWIDDDAGRNFRLNLPSEARVDHIARDIKKGKWQLTHQTIAKNGTQLIDGLHRLSACVLAGRSIQCYVAFNVPTQVVPVIDTGLKRNFQQYLRYIKVNRYKNVAAICNGWKRLAAGRWQSHNAGGIIFSVPEMIAFYKKYKVAVCITAKIID